MSTLRAHHARLPHARPCFPGGEGNAAYEPWGGGGRARWTSRLTRYSINRLVSFDDSHEALRQGVVHKRIEVEHNTFESKKKESK